ncbi:MAG: hypothetical protein K2G88_10440 [Oscillospiraceae bacterium]|nr:hypothetical protein [Oscillospiraceae bacterium]
MSHNKYKINNQDWDKIVSQAFSPDMPEPKFSNSYYQRRQELERRVTMKQSHKAERRNKAGFAVLTACVAGMAGFAIYGGVNLYQIGKVAQQSENLSDFSVGSEVLLNAEEETESVNTIFQSQSLKSYGETSNEAFSFEIYFTCQEDEHTSNGGYYDVKSDWLPEDKTAFALTFQRVADVTKDFYKKFDNVLSYQAFQTSSDNEAYYLILDNMLQLYVHFSGTPYIATYYINDLSITGDEVQKLADNLYLEVSDTETAVLWTPESQEYSIEDMPYVQRIEFQCEENDYTANGGCYDLQLNWLPDGLELAGDNSPYYGKYHNFSDESDEHAMTPSFCRVEDVSQNFVVDVDYAVDRLEMELDSGEFKKQMVLITRDKGYSQLYVHFEGTPYVADYYIKGFTQEEAIQLADNMTLVETEEETAGIYQEAWTIDKQFADPSFISQLIAAEKNGLSESNIYCSEIMRADKNEWNLVHIGDTVNKSIQLDDVSVVENPDIQLTINDATLQSDFTGVTTNGIGLPEDFSGYLNEDGELYVSKTVTKVGNGLTSIDEFLGESVVKQYILKLDVTLTRTGESFEMDDEDYYDNHGLCFSMPLMSIVDNQIWCGDYIGGSLHMEHEPNFHSNSFFSFYTEHEHDHNGIYDLEVGESANCVLYYAVDEDQIGNLYISLFDTGEAILDLCDLSAPDFILLEPVSEH